MTRLEILQNSLAKKEARFDELLAAHFADVKSANGQPLNDKRCGPATMRRWEKQNDALRRQKAEIQKTLNAIEYEEGKQRSKAYHLERMPQIIRDYVAAGKLEQWGKYPDTFFVVGVEKARMQYKNGKLYYRYARCIPNEEQFALFRETLLAIDKAIQEETA